MSFRACWSALVIMIFAALVGCSGSGDDDDEAGVPDDDTDDDDDISDDDTDDDVDDDFGDDDSAATWNCRDETDAIFPEFVKVPDDRPVIDIGRKDRPVLTADPSVLKDDEGYHLFYTTLFCKRGDGYYYSYDPDDPFACNVSDTIGTIGYAFSGDRGLTWEFRGSPVVMPGPYEWDDQDIETAHIMTVGDRLVLLYSAFGHFNGQPFEARYQIGAATVDLAGRSIHEAMLTDEEMFEKRAEPLVPFDTEQTSFINNTQEPSAVVGDEKIEVFFVGLGLSRPDRSILALGQVITSIGLLKAEFDLDLNMTEEPGAKLLSLVNITEVSYHDDAYLLFYTTLVDNDLHRYEEIVLRSSADGTGWSQPQIVLSQGEETDFDNWGLMAPTLVEEETGYVLFYTAWGYDDRPCSPIPEGGRFGMPTPDNAMCMYAQLGRAVSCKP